MNNAVGYTPIGKFDLPDPTRHRRHRRRHVRRSQGRLVQIAGRPRRHLARPRDPDARQFRPACVAALGVTLGKLEIGAAADVVVTDYIPFTPLTTENFTGHFLFAMSARNVRHVIANGVFALRDRVALMCDEPAVRASLSNCRRRPLATNGGNPGASLTLAAPSE